MDGVSDGPIHFGPGFGTTDDLLSGGHVRSVRQLMDRTAQLFFQNTPAGSIRFPSATFDSLGRAAGTWVGSWQTSSRVDVGTGSFALIIANVPVPASVMIFSTLAGAGLMLRRRRSSFEPNTIGNTAGPASRGTRPPACNDPAAERRNAKADVERRPEMAVACLRAWFCRTRNQLARQNRRSIRVEPLPPVRFYPVVPMPRGVCLSIATQVGIAMGRQVVASEQ